MQVLGDERVRSHGNGVVFCALPGSSTSGVVDGEDWQSFEFQIGSAPLTIEYSCAPVPTSKVHGAAPVFVIDIESWGCTPSG